MMPLALKRNTTRLAEFGMIPTAMIFPLERAVTPPSRFDTLGSDVMPAAPKLLSGEPVQAVSAMAVTVAVAATVALNRRILMSAPDVKHIRRSARDENADDA